MDAAAVGRVLSGEMRDGCRGTRVYVHTTERVQTSDNANTGAASRCRIAQCEHAPLAGKNVLKFDEKWSIIILYEKIISLKQK